jgi:hypothetical protein
MRKHGFASKTQLYDLNVLEGEGDKSSLSLSFSGKVIDLAEARRILEEQFPHAYVEKKDKDLRLVIPIEHKEDSPTAIDLVEKVIDLTHCKLNYYYTIEAKPHGSKLVPELGIELDGDHSNESLYGRIALDVLLRKIDPSKTHDPFKGYTYKRNGNGRSILIRPNNEVCETPEQAMQFGGMMISHFRHQLEESAHHIQLAGIELAPPELRTQEEGKQTIALVLTGDERELRLAKLTIGSKEGLRLKIVAAKDDPTKRQLHVYADVPENMEDIVETIRSVHQSSGCHLPVHLAAAVIPDKVGTLPSGDSDIIYRPATAMVFDVDNINYDPVLVQALAIYASSYTQGGGRLTFPLLRSEDGSVVGLTISRPTVLIAREPYVEIKEAWTRAVSITSRLKSLLEHDEPEQKIER